MDPSACQNGRRYRRGDRKFTRGRMGVIDYLSVAAQGLGMSDLHLPALRVGLRHCETMTVEEQHLVPALARQWPDLADMPPAFATAMMIGFIEHTCIQGLRPFLTEGQRTVGGHVDVSHTAATPAGMKVTATVELSEIDGRSLLFTVRCEDDAGLIGEGRHRRIIIDADRFIARLKAKAETA